MRVETEVLLAMLAMVRAGELSLLNSDVLVYEVNQTSDPMRRADVQDMLALSDEFVELDESITQLAEQYVQAGVPPIDALHFASASLARADFFVTCDDRLLRKIASLRSGTATTAIALVESIREVTK